MDIPLEVHHDVVREERFVRTGWTGTRHYWDIRREETAERGDVQLSGDVSRLQLQPADKGVCE